MPVKRIGPLLAAAVLALLVAACGAVEPTPLGEAASPTPSLTLQSNVPSPPLASTSAVPPVATNPRIEDPNQYSFSPLLPFDGIPPVYDPQFVSAADAPLLDDELIIGVALSGEAKAYPITVLRFREMVNDELAGIPILVTW